SNTNTPEKEIEMVIVIDDVTLSNENSSNNNNKSKKDKIVLSTSFLSPIRPMENLETEEEPTSHITQTHTKNRKKSPERHIPISRDTPILPVVKETFQNNGHCNDVHIQLHSALSTNKIHAFDSISPDPQLNPSPDLTIQPLEQIPCLEIFDPASSIPLPTKPTQFAKLRTHTHDHYFLTSIPDTLLRQPRSMTVKATKRPKI
ncbi:hypothetical protein RFI_40279, partial [Reticulomyxa filosa]